MQIPNIESIVFRHDLPPVWDAAKSDGRLLHTPKKFLIAFNTFQNRDFDMTGGRKSGHAKLRARV